MPFGIFISSYNSTAAVKTAAGYHANSMKGEEAIACPVETVLSGMQWTSLLDEAPTFFDFIQLLQSESGQHVKQDIACLAYTALNGMQCT